MTLPLIALIGAGHMGEALISGLIASGHPPDKIYATDPNESILSKLRAKWGITISKDNEAAVSAASVLLFAVKPQQMKEVLTDLREIILSAKPLIISIAAGIRTKTLETWLSQEIAIVRAMPNMPALIQTGAAALFANRRVKQEEKNIAESILRAVGVTVWVSNEDKMDTVTALSGSGPAYFFYVMDALQKAGIELGLSEEDSKLLIIQTAFGAAKMALESDATLKTLCNQVTSKGGTTEKALNVFKEAGLETIFKKAVTAAKDRSQELAKLVDGEQ